VSVKVDETKGMSLNGGGLHTALAILANAPLRTLLRTVVVTSPWSITFLSFAVDDSFIVAELWIETVLWYA
jgi:hypothetical protein